MTALQYSIPGMAEECLQVILFAYEYPWLQVDAAWSVWRKSFRSIQFVSEWLAYMEDERISTDLPSTLVESTEAFVGRRHDQSCLGLLVQKWNINTYNYTFTEGAFLHSRNAT